MWVNLQAIFKSQEKNKKQVNSIFEVLRQISIALHFSVGVIKGHNKPDFSPFPCLKFGLKPHVAVSFPAPSLKSGVIHKLF
jgi:hypothetical protein